MNNNVVLIFAGGCGRRMNSEIPKQFLEINGKPIIIHTAEIFEHHPNIDKIYFVVLGEYIPYVKRLVDMYSLKKVCGITAGGETSQDSIYNGLKYISEREPENSVVLLHDGVRPFVSSQVISDNIESVKEYGSAITVIPKSETTIISKDGVSVSDVTTRSETYIGQAPQSFYLKDILSAHDTVRKSENGYENIVDACTLLMSLGMKTHLVEGNVGNIKITTPEDVYIFRALMQFKENEQTFGLGKTNKIGSQYNLMK